jgi:predicted nuclease of predicted toxin-antitoxin system
VKLLFVVWLSAGNAGTEMIVRMLRTRVDVLREFFASPEAGLLVLEIFPEKI